MANRYYVTTPIYYINDVPHLGSAYTTIAADVLTRYHRIRGHETHFLTGTDEHGLKIQRVATERGMTPTELADSVAQVFRDTWPKLGCAPSDFIRTSEPRHKQGAQALWTRIVERGDIYLGHYEGLYCVGCEAYYTEKDLKQPGNVCPLHNTGCETVKEESYFFRLSKYTDRLLQFYEAHPSFVQPTSRLNEVTSFVRGGLEDLSISRTTFEWGIKVPNDPRHVMYVWFDALSNYLNALTDPLDNTRFWPANVHLVGKDILRFHAVYWPAFLLSAGYAEEELPKQIFAHGFLTYGGQKMSKSLRNTISPVALAEGISKTVGVDTVRYCLMRSIAFGQDGDFSLDDVLQRYGTDLGNSLGNLLNRILPFANAVPEKAEITDLERELESAFERGAKGAAEAFDATNPTRALETIWTAIAAANAYVDRAAPWTAKKNDPKRLGTIVSTLVEFLEGVSIMIWPVMPEVAKALRHQLGLTPLECSVSTDTWPFKLPKRKVGEALPGGAPIFPRIEPSEAERLRTMFGAKPGPLPSNAGTVEKATPPVSAATSANEPERDKKGAIDFNSFASLDLRVGRILTAVRVPKKDKLLELSVDIGEDKPRRIVAGIALAYSPEELLGKRVVVLANLPPREFAKGLVSEGMLLAAADSGHLSLVTPDREMPPGASVG